MKNMKILKKAPHTRGALRLCSFNSYIIFVSVLVSTCICAELFCSFVVQDFLNYTYDVTKSHYTERTNEKGRRTVASTVVLSRHRFGESCSDLPPLFNNQNLFVMQDSKEGRISSSAGSTLSCNEPKSVKLVGNTSNVVQSFEQALGFILSNGMFDKYQQFCIQQALQKGGAL